MIAAVVSPLTVVPTVMPIINGVTVVSSLPVLRMARGHVHVDRLINDAGWRGLDHDRVCVNDRRREIANVQVKARLADADGHAHIGRVCCGCSEKGDHHGD
jgi:hypothetical protein